ncbi:hypothetical protein CAEBREN_20910 [Caenorhabditis brenneri]|uniref:ShKT domain-containing protein n=1 Tax=Caenorhabditis brenneri TaxID=135651 RepID=G0MV30_CAEBE|nr:hypothetical protein CAEBREN_20910 [Caenorhabditis brenneri]
MSQIIFLLALVTVTACQEITIVNQKTICPDDGIIGPSIDFLCPPPTRLVLNGVCCAAEKVKFVPCEDQLDAQGNSLCPLTKLGCFRNLLGPVSLMEEIDLCAKTCGYCPMPMPW